MQIEGKENSLQALDEQPDAEFKVNEHENEYIRFGYWEVISLLVFFCILLYYHLVISPLFLRPHKKRELVKFFAKPQIYHL